MNENIDLTKILKDCPNGWNLYSPIYGEVQFRNIIQDDYPIVVELSNTLYESFMANGKINHRFDGECMLLPSKTQRDWSRFTAPWYKKDKFDPKTLQPFDKVLVKSCVNINPWKCGLFSHVNDDATLYKYSCAGDSYEVCIPYNDDTKHLVGTKDEAPEYYRYWE